MNKLLIASLILIILVFTVAFFYQSKPRVKILSNITELNSLFTPYMESEVNSHLKYIDCNPKNYYYNDSFVCFICNDFDACFGYAWVTREEGKLKMNIVNAKLENVKIFSSKNADFYLNGLASKFNCNTVNNSALSCDFSIYIVFKEERPSILLLDNANFNKISERICNNFNETLIECYENICNCTNNFQIRNENGEIWYYYAFA
jgi:hypothetical protein